MDSKKDIMWKYIVGIEKCGQIDWLKVHDPILDNAVPNRYRYQGTKKKENAHKFRDEETAVLAYNIWHSQDNPLEIPIIEKIKVEE